MTSGYELVAGDEIGDDEVGDDYMGAVLFGPDEYELAGAPSWPHCQTVAQEVSGGVFEAHLSGHLLGSSARPASPSPRAPATCRSPWTCTCPRRG